MPRFKVELMYDEDCSTVIAAREMELPSDEKSFNRVLLDLESEVFVKLGGNDFVHVSVITAMDDIPEKNIKAGDVVYRDWDDLDPSDNRTYKQLVYNYKPLWGGGPGYKYVNEWLRIYKNKRPK